MRSVLRGLIGTVCLVYLDNIVVFGKTYSDHLANLELEVARLQKANLNLTPKRFSLCTRQVEYLGQIISTGGVSTDPRKLSTLSEWQTPRSTADVQRFIGLASYYQRFVPSFAHITKPLYILTEKKAPFVWYPDGQLAFETLKTALTSPPTLAFPKDTTPFIIDTDASAFAVGAVLSQEQDGHERVIEYYNKVFKKPESNYCTTRREPLDIIKVITQIHHYLLGLKFIIRTDHA